jgi:hypothetical protein
MTVYMNELLLTKSGANCNQLLSLYIREHRLKLCFLTCLLFHFLMEADYWENSIASSRRPSFLFLSTKPFNVPNIIHRNFPWPICSVPEYTHALFSNSKFSILLLHIKKCTMPYKNYASFTIIIVHISVAIHVRPSNNFCVSLQNKIYSLTLTYLSSNQSSY